MASSPESTYSKLRAELDDVLIELQQPEVDIDRAIELHKQATTLIGKLETHLAKAKTTITSLTKQG